MAPINLNYVPRKWQRECHVRKRRFTVLALHRRAGKTELAIMELVNAALTFAQPLGMFFYVAPFLKQAKLIAWTRLKQRLAPLNEAGAIDINEGELTVTFKHNGAVIRIYGGDNPDGMRGVRLDGAIIDEVAQIKPEVWIDILQPALSDRQGWALFIGTPSGVNLFSELFYKAKKWPKDWYSALYTVHMTESLPPAEVERLQRDMAPTSFSREYLCDFTATGDAQLISLADCENSCKKIYQAHDVDYAPRILGVDVARFGDDRSCIFPRQGLNAFKPDVYHGLDNMALAAFVAAKMESWDPDAVFIDAGHGQGVIDRLKQLGYGQRIIEVHFGGKASDERYANKRAEMYYACKDWLAAGGAIPDIIELKQELAAPMYWYNPAGKIILEPKDDIKARGLPSPDMADALVLTFAHPVVKRTKHRDNVVRGVFNRKNTEYDPYNNLDH